jgi:hypothetical protein
MSASSQDPPQEQIFDIAALRELLATALGDKDLIGLCQNYFPEVYNKFSERMRNSTRRRLLLDYCERHNQLQQLVRHLRRLNSEKYREHFPNLVKPVIDKFESEKETDHIEAAKILGQLGEPGAISILEAQLLGQQNPNVRYWLALAIVSLTKR